MIKSKLTEYQEMCIEKSLNVAPINGQKNFLLAAKPGLGKTIMGMAIGLRHPPIKRIIWITPANLKANLLEELDKHVDPIHHSKFEFISHELLSRKKGLEYIQSTDFIVIDESHRFKNDKTAQRAQYLVACCKAAYGILLMTGTPKGVGYNSDLYSLMHIMGLANDRKEFEFRYTVKSKNKIVGSKNTDELMNILAPFSIWVDKSVLTLPDKNHHIIDVPIHPDIMKYSTDMAVHGEVTYNDIRLKKSIQTLLLLNSGFLSGRTDDAETKTFNIGSSKPDALIELIKSLDSQQVLIFCYYHIEVSIIEEIIKNLNLTYAIRYGMQDNDKKDQACVDFRSGKAQVLITTIPSSEMGLTFINCKHTIYYNISQSPTQLEQSQDRTHRFGQEADCQYYYLAAGELNRGLVEIQLDMVKECDAMFKKGADTKEFNLNATMKKLALKGVEEFRKPVKRLEEKKKSSLVEMYKHAFEDIFYMMGEYYCASQQLHSIGKHLRALNPQLEREYQDKIKNNADLLNRIGWLNSTLGAFVSNPDTLPIIHSDLEPYADSIHEFLDANSALIPILNDQIIGCEVKRFADRLPLLCIDLDGSLIIYDFTLLEPTSAALDAFPQRLRFRNLILKSRLKISIRKNIIVKFTEKGYKQFIVKL